MTGSAEALQQLKENIGKVFVGKEEILDLVLTALLCEGHVLIEDMPGLGKTTLVRSLANSLGLSFGRIQFTPDLTPADITGYTLFNLATGEKEVQEGALMHQIILADEINRTGPKTQSSLLEAMQEHQVTIDGKSYSLPHPFLVLATQNPSEHAGTFPLPEAQLDRFLMRISLGYPEAEEELTILSRGLNGSAPADLKPVMDLEQLEKLQQEVNEVTVAPSILNYAVALANATRKSEDIALGISPRGTLALIRAARAYALLKGRNYVLPEDVYHLTDPVLLHRITLQSQALFKQQTPKQVLHALLKTVPIPTSR